MIWLSLSVNKTNSSDVHATSESQTDPILNMDYHSLGVPTKGLCQISQSINCIIYFRMTKIKVRVYYSNL